MDFDGDAAKRASSQPEALLDEMQPKGDAKSSLPIPSDPDVAPSIPEIVRHETAATMADHVVEVSDRADDAPPIIQSKLDDVAVSNYGWRSVFISPMLLLLVALVLPNRSTTNSLNGRSDLTHLIPHLQMLEAHGQAAKGCRQGSRCLIHSVSSRCQRSA